MLEANSRVLGFIILRLVYFHIILRLGFMILRLVWAKFQHLILELNSRNGIEVKNSGR